MDATGNIQAVEVVVADGLTMDERRELLHHEGVIASVKKVFADEGRSMRAIRDSRLYRETHPTFEEYCADKWDTSRAYVHRKIEAASVMDRLLPIGNTMPTTESQVRPLAKLAPEDQAAAWAEAVATAPNGRVTAAHVERVVATRLPKGESIPDTDEGDDEPVEPAALSRAQQESAEIIAAFKAKLDRVTDGGVHTRDTMATLFDCDSSVITEFVRMCEVSPAVTVHRTYGKKGLTQYQFVATQCVTGHARVRQLAEEIATDPSADVRSRSSAARIIQLLGG